MVLHLVIMTGVGSPLAIMLIALLYVVNLRSVRFSLAVVLRIILI